MKTRMFAGMVCMALLVGAASAELAAPFDLRCEYRTNPLGIDVAQPRLSWNLSSVQRNQMQSAYQVLVAGSAEQLAAGTGDIWDSGKVESDASIHVVYAGKALASHTVCWWKVRAWDRDGKESPWSEPAMWSMGVLNANDWAGAQWVGLDETGASPALLGALKSACWIWFNEGAPESAAPIAERFFRTTFDLSGKPVLQAACLLAADNEAALYVNGVRVGEAASFAAATEFPLAQYLRPGKNVVAVSVENAGDAPNPAGLLAAIRIEQESSDPVVIATGGQWKSNDTSSPGWEKNEFEDASWASAKVLGNYGLKPWGDTSPSPGRVLPARMLRKEFDTDQAVRRATAYLSGLGLSELYVNGAKAGDAVLSPGCTEYEKRAFYVTYDITSQIQSGKNALGVILGNGRFFAPRTQEPTATKTYNLPCMLLSVRLEMADGSIRTVVSDPTWKLTVDGPIRANNEYDGETYDALREQAGWDMPGFNDAAWSAAMAVEGPKGAVCAQMAEPIRVTERVTPIGITNPKPGVFVFDMGQNMVGWCKLTVSGPKGTTVQLRHAETTLEDGSIYLANIRGAKVTDLYTLKGTGLETYQPRFTYHGFRYVEVTGFPGTPTLNTLEGQVVHDDVKPAGTFQSSSPLLNKVASNIRWGTRGNYRSMPTDCPQRDERQGWMGDRSEECRGESYIFDIAPLYSKWVGDMEDAQKENGSVSDVCPAYWPIYGDDVTWPSTFIIAPGMLYEQYGDLRAIERHYDGMKKWINHMNTYVKDGIIDKDSYGDWCVPPEEQHLIHSKDPARRTAGDFLATAYLYRDHCLMAKYADLLGKQQEAAEFQATADRMKAAFNAKFLDAKEKRYSNGTETSCVLPLAFGLAPEEVRADIFARLVDHIMEAGKGHLSTGLIGGQWLMRVLSNNGRPDVAETLSLQTTYPSWGYMISKNATTVWELWNGDTADPAMNSHNHVMLVGDLNVWLYETLAGIKPAAPGFKELTIHPYIARDLSFVTASHKTPYGSVFSSWRKQDGRLVWQVSVPVNTVSRITVPANDAASVTESGKPLADAQGITAVESKNGEVTLTAGSGQYTFEAPLQ